MKIGKVEKLVPNLKDKKTYVVHTKSLKGTLMQIWISLYMFVFTWKQYSENFAFLILRILDLFTREVCKFLKK